MAPSNQNERNFTAPRTPAEELIAVIYGSLLGVEKIGVFDSFLDLGGSPELAHLLTARVRELFRVEITVNDVLTVPTVDQLVNRLAQKWGGREIVDEIAWTLAQVDQLPDGEAESMLQSEIDEASKPPDHSDRGQPATEGSIKTRLVEVLLRRTGITLEPLERPEPGD